MPSVIRSWRSLIMSANNILLQKVVPSLLEQAKPVLLPNSLFVTLENVKVGHRRWPNAVLVAMFISNWGWSPGYDAWSNLHCASVAGRISAIHYTLGRWTHLKPTSCWSFAMTGKTCRCQWMSSKKPLEKMQSYKCSRLITAKWS